MKLSVATDCHRLRLEIFDVKNHRCFGYAHNLQVDFAPALADCRNYSVGIDGYDVGVDACERNRLRFVRKRIAYGVGVANRQGNRRFLRHYFQRLAARNKTARRKRRRQKQHGKRQ